MANQKILEKKQQIVDEIKDKVENSNSVVLFEYRGLSVGQLTELRKKLRESGSDMKIYKNTLTKRALDSLNINLDEHLQGPKAMAYGEDSILPIKILNDFAKNNNLLEMKVGIVDGEIADLDKLKSLATIPSREGLLTMLAGGLMQIPKDLAICLDLYSQGLEK